MTIVHLQELIQHPRRDQPGVRRNQKTIELGQERTSTRTRTRKRTHTQHTLAATNSGARAGAEAVLDHHHRVEIKGA